ncbi:MAG TPA: DNA polymerase III subunit gamma/tau [Candidatus Saccharimonadales bacterium]
MAQALYRKYRSKSLSDIVGQEHVTDILQRSLAAGRISHAYLLTGPKGVGKTSIARILAHEINKLPYNDDSTHLDIIEIDAASNNGVEDIRELRDKVQIAPVSAAKKVYIIDEVHMLSKAAFNALLKTLEEPPEHAVFILATTDVDKLPATIISRTQRFSFRPISTKDAIKHLKYIATTEGITIDDAALELIAQRGDGSFRDSISLLDQLTSLASDTKSITKELIEQTLGLAPSELVNQLLEAYESHNLAQIVALLNASEQSGIQPTVLSSQLVQTLRERIVEKPQLLPLLDQLLEVGKSSKPTIKLLTILAAHSAQKTKSAALSAPPAEVSAPIAELERQATKPKPVVHQRPAATPRHAPEPTPTIEAPQGKSGDAHLENLNWENVVEFARKNYVAIYSVLKKCFYEVDGDRLIIYTGSAFYKKKLDDAKYRVNIATILEETGAGNPAIEVVGTPPPPKDSTAAAVAAIMGGGEEVSVDN